MAFRLIASCVLTFVVASSNPASACEIDPFFFQLPGESLSDAQERSDKTTSGHSIVRLYNRELSNWKLASHVYLAKVTQRTPGNWVPGKVADPAAIVKPIVALKGQLPSLNRRLTGLGAGGTCTDYGDGFGSFSDVDRLIVVFEGLPKTEERPRGIDSFQARSIRTISLLDELRKHGKDLEE